MERNSFVKKLGVLLGLASAVSCAVACGGAPARVTVGAAQVSREAYLRTVAPQLAEHYCADSDLRRCYEIDDAECVRAVGDAILTRAIVDPLPGEVSVEEQDRWARESARSAAQGAFEVFTLERRASDAQECQEVRADEVEDPNVHQSALQARVVEGPRGLCVRMIGDETACAGQALRPATEGEEAEALRDGMPRASFLLSMAMTLPRMQCPGIDEIPQRECIRRIGDAVLAQAAEDFPESTPAVAPERMRSWLEEATASVFMRAVFADESNEGVPESPLSGNAMRWPIRIVRGERSVCVRASDDPTPCAE